MHGPVVVGEHEFPTITRRQRFRPGIKPPPAVAAGGDNPPLLQLTDELFFSMSAFLDARSLGCLACSSGRFWRNRIGLAPALISQTTRATPLLRPRSLVEESARLRVAAFSAEERDCVPRHTTVSLGGHAQFFELRWLEVLKELEILRAPRLFTRIGPRVSLCEGGVVALRSGVTCHAGHRAAVCSSTMRAGRHYQEFALLGAGEAGSCSAMVGVCGAGFDPSSGVAACSSHRARMLAAQSGLLHWKGGRNFAGHLAGRSSPWPGKNYFLGLHTVHMACRSYKGRVL
jgi:hypothetical protein